VEGGEITREGIRNTEWGAGTLLRWGKGLELLKTGNVGWAAVSLRADVKGGRDL